MSALTRRLDIALILTARQKPRQVTQQDTQQVPDAFCDSPDTGTDHGRLLSCTITRSHSRTLCRFEITGFADCGFPSAIGDDPVSGADD